MRSASVEKETIEDKAIYPRRGDDAAALRLDALSVERPARRHARVDEGEDGEVMRILQRNLQSKKLKVLSGVI